MIKYSESIAQRVWPGVVLTLQEHGGPEITEAHPEYLFRVFLHVVCLIYLKNRCIDAFMCGGMGPDKARKAYESSSTSRSVVIGEFINSKFSERSFQYMEYAVSRLECGVVTAMAQNSGLVLKVSDDIALTEFIMSS